jgi:hypothetical protein
MFKVLHLKSRQMLVVKAALMKMIGQVKKYGYMLVESLVRPVKNRLRGIISTSPFSLSLLFVFST